MGQFFVPVFEEHFNGDTLNEYHWKYINASHQRVSPDSAEFQYYTTTGGNHIFSNGVLHIRAKEEQLDTLVFDFYPSSCDKDSFALEDCPMRDGRPNFRHFDYTSGEIDSRRFFKYGIFEIRTKVPSEPASKPSFWLYHSRFQQCSELDIFEIEGTVTDILPTNYHWFPFGCDSTEYESVIDAQASDQRDFSTQFNDLALIWSPTQLLWTVADGNYFDVVRTTTHTDIFKNQMQVIANLSVNKRHGNPLDATYPYDYQIDHIKVLKQMDCTQNVTYCDFGEKEEDPSFILGGTVEMAGNNCEAIVKSGKFQDNEYVRPKHLDIVAAERITLKPGFHAERGSRFKAKIDCLTNSNKTASPYDAFGHLFTEETDNNDTLITAYKAGDRVSLQGQVIPHMRLFPNPSKGEFTVQLTNAGEQPAVIQLFDLVGKNVATIQQPLNNGFANAVINISGKPKGVYLLKVTVGGNVFTEKVVVE